MTTALLCGIIPQLPVPPSPAAGPGVAPGGWGRPPAPPARLALLLPAVPAHRPGAQTPGRPAPQVGLGKLTPSLGLAAAVCG